MNLKFGISILYLPAEIQGRELKAVDFIHTLFQTWVQDVWRIFKQNHDKSPYS